MGDHSRMSILDQGVETLNDEDPYNTEFGPHQSSRVNPYDMKYSVSQRNHASEEMFGGDPDET
jgi:hypothetical protein